MQTCAERCACVAYSIIATHVLCRAASTATPRCPCRAVPPAPLPPGAPPRSHFTPAVAKAAIGTTAKAAKAAAAIYRGTKRQRGGSATSTSGALTTVSSDFQPDPDLDCVMSTLSLL